MQTSDIIALYALVVAAVSIMLAVYEGYQTRKHHRLSLRPVMISTFHGSAPEGRFTFGIENVGLGPAFIDEVVVVHEAETFNISQQRPFASLSEALGIYRPEGLYATLAPGDALAVGERLQLIECGQLTQISVEEMKNITDILRDLDMTVKYRTLYGEKIVYQTSVARTRKATDGYA